MIKRSHGALDFRTTPTGFGRMGAEIRLLNEQGRIHELHIGTSETMVSAQSHYSDEQFRISCRVFGPVGGSVYDADYRLKRPVERFELKLPFLKRMYEEVSDLGGYVSVKMDSRVVVDVEDYVRRIFDASGRVTVPAWTFLVKDEYCVSTIYIRRYFLEQFKAGKDILNYTRIMAAVKRSREQAKRENKFDYYYRRSRL